MKISIKKLQEGGPMPGPEPAEQVPGGEMAQQEQQAENPLIQIAQMAMQALQSGDCQASMQVCEAFIQLIQQGSEQASPEEAPQGEPVYRQGGILVRRIKE